MARQTVRAVAAAWPIELVDDALLAATEVVTNAVRHGQPPVDLSVQLLPAPHRSRTGAASSGPPDRRSRRASNLRRPGHLTPSAREVLHVQVQDAGRGLPEGDGAERLPDGDPRAGHEVAESGRGLLITAAVTSRWGSHLLHAGAGTLVWFELDGP